MTTKDSPKEQLWAQARLIVTALKRYLKGHRLDTKFKERLDAAKDKPSITLGIIMDDKVLTLELKWTDIKLMSEVQLIEYIVKYMQEKHEVIH